MYAKSLTLSKRIGEASSEVKQGRSFRGTQQCLSAVVRNVTTKLRFVQVICQRVMTSSEIRQGSAGRSLLCLGNNERRDLKSLSRLWPCYLASDGVSMLCGSQHDAETLLIMRLILFRTEEQQGNCETQSFNSICLLLVQLQPVNV